MFILRCIEMPHRNSKVDLDLFVSELFPLDGEESPERLAEDVVNKPQAYSPPKSWLLDLSDDLKRQLLKVDDFMCLLQKCPFWLWLCF